MKGFYLLAQSAIFASAILGAFPQSVLADSLYLFHWGTPEENAAILNASGYSFHGPHFNDLNTRGSVEVGQGVFKYARDHYDPQTAEAGPGLYVAPDLFSSAGYGGAGNDLLVIEIHSNGDPKRFFQNSPDQKTIGRDVSTHPEVLDRYPLLGKYPKNDWGVFYRTPNDEERAQGVQVLVRPPEAGDVIRIWDAMTGGQDSGKINLLRQLGQEIVSGHEMTPSSKILLHRLFFDVGYGFLDHYIDPAHVSPERISRWHGEITVPLQAYVQSTPGSQKTMSLLHKWSLLPGSLSDGHVADLANAPKKLTVLLQALEPADRERVLTDFINELLPKLQSRANTSAYKIAVTIGPAIRSSSRSSELLDKLRPFGDGFAQNLASLKQNDPSGLAIELGKGTLTISEVVLKPLEQQWKKDRISAPNFTSQLISRGIDLGFSEPEVFGTVARRSMELAAAAQLPPHINARRTILEMTFNAAAARPENQQRPIIAAIREAVLPYVGDDIDKLAFGPLATYSVVYLEKQAQFYKLLLDEFPELKHGFVQIVAERSKKESLPKLLELAQAISLSECFGSQVKSLLEAY